MNYTEASKMALYASLAGSHTATVDFAGLTKAYAELGREHPDAEALATLAEMKKIKEDKITFEDFKASLAAPHPTKLNVLCFFTYADLDKDHKLNKAELIRLFSLPCESNTKSPEEIAHLVDHLFPMMDADHDGIVSVDDMTCFTKSR